MGRLIRAMWFGALLLVPVVASAQQSQPSPNAAPTPATQAAARALFAVSVNMKNVGNSLEEAGRTIDRLGAENLRLTEAQKLATATLGERDWWQRYAAADDEALRRAEVDLAEKDAQLAWYRDYAANLAVPNMEH